MTTKNITYSFNKISALFSAGVLLFLIELISFSNFAISKNTFEFYSKNDTTLNIKMSFESNANKILVFAKEDTKIIEPLFGKKYIPKKNYKNLDTNSTTGQNNLVVFSGNHKEFETSIGGLTPDTKYILYCYEENSDSKKMKMFDDYDLFTVVKAPEKSSFNILYKNTEATEITIGFRKGKGQKHLIVAREENPAEDAINGTVYDCEKEFGKGQIIGNNSYAIYDGIDTNFTIKNLKPNTEYHFRIYDYNGTGKKTSYNVEKGGGNPSAKRTFLISPKAIEVGETKVDGFAPRWEKAPIATTYEIDVAKDKEFKEILVDYKKIDVGDITEFYVDGLAKNTTYFYRIYAKNAKNLSKPSNAIEVKTKD